MNGASLVDVDGGTFDDNVYGIFDEIDSVNIYGGSFSNVYDVFVDPLTATVNVNIYGGTFGNLGNAGGANLNSLEGGTITLYGSDFTQNGVALPYGPLPPIQFFSGQLQNDATAQTFAYGTFDYGMEGGSIVIAPSAAPAVPEPSSFVLLGLALPALGLFARRRARA